MRILFLYSVNQNVFLALYFRRMVLGSFSSYKFVCFICHSICSSSCFGNFQIERIKKKSQKQIERKFKHNLLHFLLFAFNFYEHGKYVNNDYSFSRSSFLFFLFFRSFVRLSFRKMKYYFFYIL